MATKGGLTGTALRQAYQGLTLGAGDEAIDYPTSLAVSMLTGQDFNDVLKQARGMTRKELAGDWKERPVVSLGANIVGGIPLGTGAAAAKLGNWAKTGSKALRATKGFGLGAGTGAVTGLTSETPDENSNFSDATMERLRSAGIGLGVGGVLGGLAGSLGRGKPSGSGPDYSKVAKRVAKSAPSKAEKMFAEELAARPDLPEQLNRVKEMQRASQNTGISLTLPEMIAQSPSERLLAQQKLLLNNPQTAGRMEALYAARSGTQNMPGQIENQLMKQAQSLDPSVGSYDEAAAKLIAQARDKQGDITKGLMQEATPLYQQAYRGTVPDEAMADPFIQAQIKDIRSNPLYATMLQDVPDNSVQMVDIIKKRIEDMSNSAARSGNRFEAGQIGNMGRSIVEAADQAAPAYKQAREVYSGNPDMLAMRERIGNLAGLGDEDIKKVGSRLFDGTQRNADMTAQALASPAFNQIGPQNPKTAAAARIYEAMDTLRNDPTALADKIAPNARTADMLRSYVGGPQLDETLNVINQARIGDKFRYGSPTQPLTQEANKLEQIANTAIDLKTGGASSVIKKVAGMFGNKGQDPQFYEDLYQIMATPKGVQLMEQIASGQSREIASQLATPMGRNMIKGIIGTTDIPNTAVRGIIPGFTSGIPQQQPITLTNQQELPAGYTIRQQAPMQELPAGYTIRN